MIWVIGAVVVIDPVHRPDARSTAKMQTEVIRTQLKLTSSQVFDPLNQNSHTLPKKLKTARTDLLAALEFPQSTWVMK
jgi:hypothetical protein